MAKCTEKERELIDSYLNNTITDELVVDILRERVSKENRNRLKHAYKNINDAKKNLDAVLSEFYAICSDKNMSKLVDEIHAEAME